MLEYKSIKYRYFFMSFSISLCVLALLFWSLMSIVHPKTPDSLYKEPEFGTQAAVYLPQDSDALSVLFIGGLTESEAETYILVRFDPVRGKIPVVVFPPQTAVQNSGRMESLAEVYRYGGTDYTRDALARTLGIPIDRYVRMRVDAFVAGAAAIGTVEFDLQQSIVINRGGTQLTLNQGKQLLDGGRVSEIIRYPAYPGGELERCRLTGELSCAIINQRMDICLSTVVDTVFEKLINLISSDISQTDYQSRKPAAQFLAQMGQEPAIPIAVSGSWNDGESLYTLSDTFIALLTQTMQ